MHPANQITREITQISEEILTESILISPGIQVQRITVTRQGPDGPTIQIREKVSDSQPTIGKPEKYPSTARLVDPKLLDRLRLEGWSDINPSIRHLPFTCVLSGEPYVVVRINYSTNQVKDLSGEFLPVGMQFNYIDGQTSDHQFDLTRLVEYLEKRPDIQFHRGPYRQNVIQEIPGYNQYGNSGYQFIQFTWQPEVHQYREFMKLARAADSFERRRIAITFLGLDIFRIPEEVRLQRESEWESEPDNYRDD